MRAVGSSWLSACTCIIYKCPRAGPHAGSVVAYVPGGKAREDFPRRQRRNPRVLSESRFVSAERLGGKRAIVPTGTAMASRMCMHLSVFKTLAVGCWLFPTSKNFRVSRTRNLIDCVPPGSHLTLLGCCSFCPLPAARCWLFAAVSRGVRFCFCLFCSWGGMVYGMAYGMVLVYGMVRYDKEASTHHPSRRRRV